MEFPQRVSDLYNEASAGDARSKLRLIFVVREPVERELVVYNMKANDYNQSADKKNGWFADAVESDGSLMSFTRYSLGKLRFYIKDKAAFYRSGLYAMHLKVWAKLFDRSQILVLNYDELRDDPSKVQWRIQQFIGRKFNRKLVTDDTIMPEDIPTRAIEVLEPLFRESNNELYSFLKTSPGPPMEEKPFPPFQQRITPKEHKGLVLPNVLIIGAQKAGTSAVRNTRIYIRFV